MQPGPEADMLCIMHIALTLRSTPYRIGNAGFLKERRSPGFMLLCPALPIRVYSTTLSSLGPYLSHSRIRHHKPKLLRTVCGCREQTRMSSPQDLAPSSRAPGTSVTPLISQHAGTIQKPLILSPIVKKLPPQLSKFPQTQYHSTAGKPKCVRSQASDHFLRQPSSPSPVPTTVHP